MLSSVTFTAVKGAIPLSRITHTMQFWERLLERNSFGPFFLVRLFATVFSKYRSNCHLQHLYLFVVNFVASWRRLSCGSSRTLPKRSPRRRLWISRRPYACSGARSPVFSTVCGYVRFLAQFLNRMCDIRYVQWGSFCVLTSKQKAIWKSDAILLQEDYLWNFVRYFILILLIHLGLRFTGATGFVASHWDDMTVHPIWVVITFTYQILTATNTTGKHATHFLALSPTRKQYSMISNLPLVLLIRNP